MDISFRIRSPYKWSVRCVLWAVGLVVFLIVGLIAGLTSDNDSPLAVFALLQVPLFFLGTGVVAGLALFRPPVWNRLVNERLSRRQAETRLSWMIGGSVMGLVITAFLLWDALP